MRTETERCCAVTDQSNSSVICVYELCGVRLL